MKKSTRLRELFDRPEIFILPGGGCALHAKLIEAAGFEAVYMSGSMTSAYILGMPDAGMIDASEMIRNAANMASIVDIPLLSDADTGFGNAINVRRTVQGFVSAGVAGIHIEDQVSPKRCGFVKGKQVIPIDEAVGKIQAAVEAKNELDKDFVIVARTDAKGAVGGSLDEAISRAKAYLNVGADVIYVEGPETREDLKAIRDALECPVFSAMYFLDPQPDIQELQNLGQSAAIYPRLAARAGYIATWNFLKDFANRGIVAEVELLQKYKTHPLGGLKLFDTLGFAEIRRLEEKYLPEDTSLRYEQSRGLYEPE